VAFTAVSLAGRDSTAFAVKWAASIIWILGYAGTAFGWTPWILYLFVVGVLGWQIDGAL
jgi:hypothetical protein